MTRNKATNQNEVKNGKNDKDKRMIYIGNLRNFLTKNQIGKHFNLYGNIKEIKIVDNSTKQSGYKRKQNFGFVTFEDAKSVERVFNDLVSLLLIKYLHVCFY